jgi:hypothetical protein
MGEGSWERNVFLLAKENKKREILERGLCNFIKRKKVKMKN